jgi:hypothetical protein
MTHLPRSKQYGDKRVRALWRGVAVALALITSTVQAMSFEASPPYLYLGGPVVREDWDTWEEAMIRYGDKIDTVVFHQSGGGDAFAGRRIGHDIRKRGLNTVVLGRCSSACANMFLGGVARQFGASTLSTQTVLGYHGSYNKSTGVLNTRRDGDYFAQMTDSKMDEAFIARFIRLENKQGLMRFVHKEQRTSNAQPLAMLCKGDEDRRRRDEQCEKLNDIDALSKGVVTTWDVRTVAAPASPTREKVSEANWRVGDAEQRDAALPPG